MRLTGKTVLVSGANRGIGLELVTQLVKNDDITVKKVFAACRNPDKADELRNLQAEHGEKVEILKLDITKDEEIAAAVKFVEKMSPNGLNLLINNAGVAVYGTADRPKLRHIMEVNFISTQMMCQAFSEHLKTAAAAKNGDAVNAVVVNISSECGSLTLASSQTVDIYPGYHASKAAVNMLSCVLAQDLGGKSGHGVVTLALHPGWVRTSMGGPHAPMKVQDSAAAILKVLQKIDVSHNGSFLDYKGEKMPW